MFLEVTNWVTRVAQSVKQLALDLSSCLNLRILLFFYFFKDFIYLFIDTEREAETQAEGEREAGSMQGARCGT